MFARSRLWVWSLALLEPSAWGSGGIALCTAVTREPSEQSVPDTDAGMVAASLKEIVPWSEALLFQRVTAGVRDKISAAKLWSPLSALISPFQSRQEAMGPAQGCARWLLYSFQRAEVKGDGPMRPSPVRSVSLRRDFWKIPVGGKSIGWQVAMCPCYLWTRL